MKDCIICKSKKNKLIHTINGYKVYKCAACAFVYTSPLPTKEELKKYYSKFTYADGFVYEHLVRADAKRILNNFSRLHGNKKGALLDLGSGAGFLMDEARKSGWKSLGVEIAKIPLKNAEKLKLKIIKKDIHEFSTDQKFDAVVLSQVIEHLSDPYPTLEKIHKLLKNDGIACISTPNIESYLYHVTKEKFLHLTPPHHLFFFSPKTLVDILEKSGFSVVKLISYGYPEDVGSIYRALRNRNKAKDKGSINNAKEKATDNMSAKENKPNSLSRVKHYIFENIVRDYTYRLLDINQRGSMVEAYVKKKKN